MPTGYSILRLMERFLNLTLIGFFLIACTSIPVPEVAPPILATPTQIVPTPTGSQLPFDPNVSSDDYCRAPYAVLPVSDGNDISEDEIVYELVKIWLRRYIQPNAPAFCRIEDYSIDRVYDDPGVYSNALEPRGDFMRVVAFSVRLSQIPNYWMSFPGELDSDNWLHSGHIVAVTAVDEGYKMEFANP